MPARRPSTTRRARPSRAAARADLVADLLGDLEDPVRSRPRKRRTGDDLGVLAHQPPDSNTALLARLDSIVRCLEEILGVLQRTAAEPAPRKKRGKAAARNV